MATASASGASGRGDGRGVRPRRRRRTTTRRPGRISVAISPGWVRRRDDRLGGVGAELGGRRRPADPARHVGGERLDVALERRVVLLVVGGVVADDVHDRRVRAPGVVQVGEAVAEAGAEVQQRRRRAVRHARVAVGRAGDDALEQAEHRPHPRLAVERGDEVHLGRAGVGEAHVDVVVDERAQQGLGAVHGHAVTVPSDRARSPRSSAGVEDAVRVERGLDAAHQRELGRVLELEEVRAAWPGRCRARRRSRRRAPCRRRTGRAAPARAPRGRAWNTERCTLPSPAWPQPAIQEPVAAAMARDPLHEVGERRARHDDVDDVVGVVRLGDPEALLAGVDELRRRAARAARTRRARRARRAAPRARATSSSRRRVATSAPSPPRGTRARCC